MNWTASVLKRHPLPRSSLGRRRRIQACSSSSVSSLTYGFKPHKAFFTRFKGIGVSLRPRTANAGKGEQMSSLTFLFISKTRLYMTNWFRYELSHLGMCHLYCNLALQDGAHATKLYLSFKVGTTRWNGRKLLCKLSGMIANLLK